MTIEVLRKASEKSKLLLKQADLLKRRGVALERYVNRFDSVNRNYINELLPNDVSKEHYEKIANLNQRIGINRNQTLTAFKSQDNSFGYDAPKIVDRLYANGIEELEKFSSEGIYSHKTYGYAGLIFGNALSKILTRRATKKDLEDLSQRINEYHINEQRQESIRSGLEKFSNKYYDNNNQNSIIK